MSACVVAAQFVLTAWRRVMTPFQAASITVQSYPGKADILAMIKCAFCDPNAAPRAAHVITFRTQSMMWCSQQTFDDISNTVHASTACTFVG